MSPKTDKKQSDKPYGYDDLILAGVTYGEKELEPGTVTWEEHFIPLVRNAFREVTREMNNAK